MRLVKKCMDENHNPAAGGAMSWHSHLKIPKKLTQVTVWIQPEGRVNASLYLNIQGKHGADDEALLDFLNQTAPFLVLRREDCQDVCFYNKAYIIRAEYNEESTSQPVANISLPCQLQLSDGSVIEGHVRELLRPEHSRLLDYLNLDDGPFAKIYVGQGKVCLVNKACVVSAIPLRYRDGADSQEYSTTRDAIADLCKCPPSGLKNLPSNCRKRCPSGVRVAEEKGVPNGHVGHVQNQEID
jgi:hypothetical protein